MAAGYLSNGACLTTLLEAAQSFCSDYPKQLTAINSTTPVTYQCTTTGTAGGFIIRGYSGATAGTAYTITPSYATCDTNTFSQQKALFPWSLSVAEGSTIAGSIAAIWALAWVIRALVRSLNTDGEKE